MLRVFGLLVATLALQLPTDVVAMNSLLELHLRATQNGAPV